MLELLQLCSPHQSEDSRGGQELLEEEEEVVEAVAY